MDPVHAHLLFNHIPILGSVFGAVLLLIGILLKNRSVEVTALATLALVAAMTIPAYLSGEEAEHLVEELASVSEWELEEHEEHAELSLWLMMSTGVLAILTLFSYYYMESMRRYVRMLCVVMGFATFLSMIPLALHGGKIIHSELRGDAAESTQHHDD